MRDGRTHACGISSGSFTLAHIVAASAFNYWKDRIGVNNTELMQTLSRLLDPEHQSSPVGCNPFKAKFEELKNISSEKQRYT